MSTNADLNLFDVDEHAGIIYWDNVPVARLLAASHTLSYTQRDRAIEALTTPSAEIICPECAGEFEAAEQVTRRETAVRVRASQ